MTSGQKKVNRGLYDIWSTSRGTTLGNKNRILPMQEKYNILIVTMKFRCNINIYEEKLKRKEKNN